MLINFNIFEVELTSHNIKLSEYDSGRESQTGN